MISSLTLSVLQSAINQGLALDPGSQQALVGLQGKTVKIHCFSPEISFTVHIDGKDHISLQLLPANEEQPTGDTVDLTLNGTGSQFVELLQHIKQDDPLSQVDLKLAGERELFYQLLTIFHNMDIDWEEGLSSLIGDLASHPLANSIRQVLHWQLKQAGSLGHAISEYLHHEVEIFPSQREFEDFKQGVTDFSSRVQALEQRTKQLAAIAERCSEGSRSPQQAED